MFLKKFKTSITCVSHLMRRNNGSENLNSLIIVLPTLVLYFISFGKKKWWSVINGMNDIQSWICYVGWYHLSRILHLRFFFLIIFLHLKSALFGGMMGCAIGMSMAAACEIIYWITLKPFVKWINATKGNHLSPRAKHICNLTRNLILLSWIIYCVYKFHQVYVAFETRYYWLLCIIEILILNKNFC